VKSLIYLNLNQKKILDEANVGVHTLTTEALREYLTATDYRTIMDKSIVLQARGNILFRFGFEYTEPNDVDSPVSNSLAEYTGSGYLPENVILKDGIELKAACPNNKSIVLWESEHITDNTNGMFRQSMLNILTALSTVLLFEELKQTKQFQICLLNHL